MIDISTIIELLKISLVETARQFIDNERRGCPKVIANDDLRDNPVIVYRQRTTISIGYRPAFRP